MVCDKAKDAVRFALKERLRTRADTVQPRLELEESLKPRTLPLMLVLCRFEGLLALDDDQTQLTEPLFEANALFRGGDLAVPEVREVLLKASLAGFVLFAGADQFTVFVLVPRLSVDQVFLATIETAELRLCRGDVAVCVGERALHVCKARLCFREALREVREYALFHREVCFVRAVVFAKRIERCDVARGFGHEGLALRAQLLKTLGDFRTALDAEATDNPSLATAVTAAYALLDKLTADRNAAGRAAAKRKGKAGAADGAHTSATPANG